MINTKMSSIDFLSSVFTRKKGYTQIESSLSLSRKNAIKILNSFTPQGASPKISLRIGNIDHQIGAGYFFMEDQATARLTTLITEANMRGKLTPFLPPIDEKAIYRIANGEKMNFYSDLYPSTMVMDIIDSFGVEQTSSILYSLLAGDNMIVVHPEHEYRLKFIASILNVLPNISFLYNRITSECTELDGNENIIGVSQLPKKYRSHKKLYLPLDTIFIDMVDNKVEGNGIKNSHFTTEIAEILTHNVELSKKHIYDFFSSAVNQSYDENMDSASLNLINRIEVKLGLKKEIEEDWMTGF